MTLPVYGSRNGMRTSPIGATKRSNVQSEALYAKTFEELLHLHRLDFWHCTVAQRSQAGWPDYAIFGDGWLSFVELKARSLVTNKRGKVSAAQYRYKDSIEAAGAEWRTFCLPDDWAEVEAWLTGHTGRVISSIWKKSEAAL